MLAHLILTTTRWLLTITRGWYCNYLHFNHQQTESQRHERLAQDHTAHTWQGQNVNGSRPQRTHLQCRRPGLIPGLGRSPGERNSYLLQYSGLQNSIDCIVHGVAKSWTQLSDFHFHFSGHLQGLCCQPYLSSIHRKNQTAQRQWGLTHCCTAEINTTMQITYAPIKSNFSNFKK